MSYLSDLLKGFTGQKNAKLGSLATSTSYTPGGSLGLKNAQGQTLGQFIGGGQLPQVTTTPTTPSAGAVTAPAAPRLPQVAPNYVNLQGFQGTNQSGQTLGQFMAPQVPVSTPAVTTRPTTTSAGAVTSPYVSSLADINSKLGTRYRSIAGSSSYVPGSAASKRGLDYGTDTSKTPSGVSSGQSAASGGFSAPKTSYGSGVTADRLSAAAGATPPGTANATYGVGGGLPTAPTPTPSVPDYSDANLFMQQGGYAKTPVQSSATGRVEQRTKDGRYKQDGVWYFPDGSQIGGGRSSGGDDALSKALVRELSSYDVTRNDILEQMQREIDATRGIYAERVRVADEAGQGRLGSTRAVQARGGLLGSDFAGAQTEAVGQYNRDITGGIQSELDARISQIMGTGSEQLVAEREARTAALQRGSEAYLDFLAKTEERKAAKVKELAGQMLASGIEPGQFSSDQLSKLAKDLGVSVLDVQNAYQTEQLARQQLAAEAAPKGFELGEGQVRYEYDPETGGFRQVAAGAPKPVATGLSDPQKVSTFNQIVNNMNRSPLIMASDRTPVLKQSIEDINANPEDAATQLNLSYAYIQALDTYQSAVRVGELGNLNSIDSKIGSLSNSVSQIQNGQIVRPEVAKQIAAAAKSIVDTIDAAAKQKVSSFRSQARVSGVGSEFDQYLGGFDAAYSQSVTPPSPEEIQALRDQNYSEAEIQELLGPTSFNQAGNALASTPDADRLANAIMQVESGGKQVAGASGEFGSFQFLPSTWATVSREVAGSVIPQTPENEYAVARAKIGQLLAVGYDPRDVAAIWNTSLGGSEKPRYIRGVNDMGVAYDSIAYADKVMNAYLNA